MSKTFVTVFLLGLFILPACRSDEPRPDCLINAGTCARVTGGMTVTLDVAPKPVRAMRELLFTVRLVRGIAAVGGAEVEADLTMPGMNMGENRVRLREAGGGAYRGTVIIVRCPSGRTVWQASIIVNEGDRVSTAEFLFDAP